MQPAYKTSMKYYSNSYERALLKIEKDTFQAIKTLCFLNKLPFINVYRLY